MSYKTDSPVVMVTEGPHARLSLPRRSKRISGEQESRKVSPRKILKDISVSRRGLEAGEQFSYWIAVWEVDFVLIYLADAPAYPHRDP